MEWVRFLLKRFMSGRNLPLHVFLKLSLTSPSGRSITKDLFYKAQERETYEHYVSSINAIFSNLMTFPLLCSYGCYTTTHVEANPTSHTSPDRSTSS